MKETETDTKSTVKFLGKNVNVTQKEREDPTFLLYLSLLQFVELKHGEGLLFMMDMKKNYGLSPSSTTTENAIETILLRNKERKFESNDTKE